MGCGCGLRPLERSGEASFIGEKRWQSTDGFTHTYQVWEQSKQPKAAWILVHGFAGAASDLTPLAEAASDWGDVVYAINLRGMGPDVDTDLKGDVESPFEWPRDLGEFMRLVAEQHPETPIYLVGESLGVSITIVSLYRDPNETVPLAGVVMLSPVVEFGLEATALQRFMGQIFLTLVPTRRINLVDLGDEQGVEERPPITPLPEEQKALEEAPHRIDEVTLRFLVSSIELVNSTEPLVESISGVPRLIAYGGKDAFIPAARIDEFAGAVTDLEGPTEVIFYPEGHHLLLRDYPKEDLLVEIESWRFGVAEAEE